jgi:menaquinone-dependent protoporphyrinogen oxidase
MNNKILVAYASRHGSTAQIADRIHRHFKDAGISADIYPINSVDSLKGYTTVIIGSAVYVGQWRKDAGRFLKKNIEPLQEKDVWIFSTGPTGEGDPSKLLKGWIMPKSLLPLANKIGAKEITVFHGYVDPEKLTGLQRFMVNKIDAPVGDFRDWKMIDNWAKKIIKSLIADR